MKLSVSRRKKILIALGIAFLLIFAVCIGLKEIYNLAFKGLPAGAAQQITAAKTTFIYDNQGKLLAQIHGEVNRVPVTLKNISSHLQEAFLASEDARFYKHKGVDFVGLVRALTVNLQAGKVIQGGSTITQQLVKNSFLTPERSLRRKWQEMWMALNMEKRFSKDQILQMYLNEIYFGHGAYGVEAAAQLYFGKNATQLTLAESALLAAIPRWPQKYSPYRDQEAAVRRQKLILRLMEEKGFISGEEKLTAEKEKIVFKALPKTELYTHPYFVDHVLDELTERYGYTPSQVYRGGLRVYTTMDSRIQSITEETFKKGKLFPPNGPKDKVQGSIAILDYHDGSVKALVGGRDYQARRGFNRATDLKRQPGSAFKPVAVYGPALEKNLSPKTILVDSPVSYGGYRPKNSGGGYRGAINMVTAVKYSVNIYAVKLLHRIGIAEGYNFAKRLGFNLLPTDMGYPLALGGLTEGVSPLQMASAYGAFANQGLLAETHAVSKITDCNGKVLYSSDTAPKRVMKPRTAYAMTGLMQGVVRGGTGTRASLNRPVAGKTGTTQLPDLPAFKRVYGNKDAWFVGYTPELVAAVWMGFDQTDRAHYLKGVYGGTYPARLWREVMGRVLKGVPFKQFPRPADARGEWIYFKESKPVEEKQEEEKPADAGVQDGKGKAAPPPAKKEDKPDDKPDDKPGQDTPPPTDSTPPPIDTNPPPGEENDNGSGNDEGRDDDDQSDGGQNDGGQDDDGQDNNGNNGGNGNGDGGEENGGNNNGENGSSTRQ